MKRTPLIVLLAGLWALGPILGSPSSLFIVPAVAFVAALRGRKLGEAETIALASLVLMGMGWVGFGIAEGAAIVDRAVTGAGLVAAHGLAAGLLVALAWWIRGRVEHSIA